MNIVRRSLRRIVGVSDPFGTFRKGSHTMGRRAAVTTAVVGAIALGAAAGWHFSSDELLSDALGPFGMFSDVAQDDGAGDALTPAAEADRYLPVPAPFDDERVVAALGPIANLSCKKSDYARSTNDAAPPPSDLGPPLANADSTAWLDRTAAATGLSPIASLSDADDAGDAGEAHPEANAPMPEDRLSSPLSLSRVDLDDLLTRNLLAAGLSPIAALPTPESADCPRLLRYTFKKLQTGEEQSLCQFQGKVLLIVNTASHCAYTKQYEGLEAMYRKYRNRGLVVVGFPSNDFGRQEPGSNKEIAEFCRTTYGVEFPMFEKSSVAKLDANPLYMELSAKTGASPKWNFHKYVVDRNGMPIASFASDVTPDSPKLVDLIERLLAEKYAANKG
ncbi:MAG TPA: glutathione peroxidase [Casimicrobiaceae bacterium]|nr:glutathione peroxidase [Casimicrobiaceae bacterium]